MVVQSRSCRRAAGSCSDAPLHKAVKSVKAHKQRCPPGYIPGQHKTNDSFCRCWLRHHKTTFYSSNFNETLINISQRFMLPYFKATFGLSRNASFSAPTLLRLHAFNRTCTHAGKPLRPPHRHCLATVRHTVRH